MNALNVNTYSFSDRKSMVPSYTSMRGVEGAVKHHVQKGTHHPTEGGYVSPTPTWYHTSVMCQAHLVGLNSLRLVMGFLTNLDEGLSSK